MLRGRVLWRVFLGQFLVRKAGLPRFRLTAAICRSEACCGVVLGLFDRVSPSLHFAATPSLIPILLVLKKSVPPQKLRLSTSEQIFRNVSCSFLGGSDLHVNLYVYL